MPRPGPEHLLATDEVDTSPVASLEPGNLLVSLVSIVHWADSPLFRKGLMEAIGFPAGEVSMFLVVNQLAYRGAMRPTDIADALGMGRPNVSRVAARLAGERLVVRMADPHDERGVLLALSDRGRVYGRRIIAVLERRIDILLGGWDEEDAASLRSLLARFVQAMVPPDGRDLAAELMLPVVGPHAAL